MLASMLSLTMLNGGNTYAQCGSFGEPLINITFGNAANPMTSLPDTVTDYILHNGIGFMNPNYYMITDNAGNGSPDRPGAYHNIRDHTGDAGGGMLLVNASTQPGIFYTSIQRGLCSNTAFNFSAWVVNVSPREMSTCGLALPINVQFEILTIGGDTLAIVNTGEIHGVSSPEWEQFNVSFNTLDNTEVQLIIRNIGEGGCGNNLAIDDIQFRPCGPEIDLTPNITVQEDTVFLCVETNEVMFRSDVGSGYTTRVYQWQQRTGIEGEWSDMAGENDSILTVQPMHDIWYRLAVASNSVSLENPNCRVVSAPMRAAHTQVPALSLTPAVMQTCIGSSVSFTPDDYLSENVGPLTYQWYLQVGDEWTLVPNANTPHYLPPVSASGVFQYQRRAINVCGQDFAVNEFLVVVLPMDVTSLALPVQFVCLNDDPVVLTGGTPEFFDLDQPGIYSGPGVVDGLFYPDRAGLGEHIITYTPSANMHCPVPSTATLRVVEPVYVEPMEELHVLPGNSVNLRVTSNGNRYVWDFDESLSRLDTDNPTATPTTTTTYWITAFNEGGCSARDSVVVIVLTELQIPSGFTPNGDGINDLWHIEGLDDYPNVHIQVFNRWGALVFSSSGYPAPWDGRRNGSSLPAATYYYMISSDVLNKPLTGSVTILR